MPQILSSSGLRHLAVIMDGNRRWARKQCMPPLAGHQHGVEALRRSALYANDLGLSIMTVYAFSTENWLRPMVEVNGLMDLFVHALEKLLPELHANGVRLSFFGGITQLSELLQQRIRDTTELTRGNTRLRLQVAMNYGGRREIVDACSALIREYQQSGRSPSELKEEDINRHLLNPGCPDPDLILRTGGEQRLSNFLLWQAAYSEVMVTDTLWPDFSERDVDNAILNFASRKRRFGR